LGGHRHPAPNEGAVEADDRAFPTSFTPARPSRIVADTRADACTAQPSSSRLILKNHNHAYALRMRRACMRIGRNARMALYRCYFRGLTGRFGSRHDFDAETDGEAIAKARRLYAGEDVKAGFELWSGAQLVIAETTVGNKI
jgi:hypothetical protein